jgi:hypothetical protein
MASGARKTAGSSTAMLAQRPSAWRQMQQLAPVCRVLAVDLLNGEGGSHGAHVAVRELSNVLSQDSILAVLAAVASASRKTSLLSDFDVPAASLLAHWRAADLQPGDGEYTYILTEFSKQQSPMLSPEFEAAGYTWRLQVELDDDKLGLYLLSSTATSFPIVYTLKLINQVEAFDGLFRYAFI